MHLNLSEVLIQLFENKTDNITQNFDFEYLHSLDLQNITYSHEIMTVLYYNLVNKGVMRTWYKDEVITSLMRGIHIISGPFPEFYIQVYNRSYQSILEGVVESETHDTYVFLATVLEYYIPLLNSDDRVLSGKIREIIDIHDTEDLNKFLGSPSAYNYNEYITQANLTEAEVGLLTPYFIGRFIKDMSLNMVFSSIPETYEGWVDQIIGNVTQFYNDYQVSTYLQLYRDYGEFIIPVINPLVLSYSTHILSGDDHFLIELATSSLQKALQQILEKTMPLLYNSGILRIINYLPESIGKTIGIPDSGIVSEIYGVLGKRGFLKITYEHVTDIFEILDRYFPSINSDLNKDNLELYSRGRNGILGLILGMVGVDQGTGFIQDFTRSLSDELLSINYTYLGPDHPMDSLGILGIILNIVTIHTPEFCEGISREAVGRLIHSIGRVIYDHLFLLGSGRGKIFSNLFRNTYGLLTWVWDIISPGKEMPPITKGINKNSDLFNEVMVGFSQLIVQYFSNRSELSFTGLRIYNEGGIDEMITSTINNLIIGIRDKPRTFLEVLDSFHPLSEASPYYLIKIREVEMGNLFIKLYPLKYENLIRRLVKFMINPQDLPSETEICDRHMNRYIRDTVRSHLEDKSITLMTFIVLSCSFITIYLISIYIHK